MFSEESRKRITIGGARRLSPLQPKSFRYSSTKLTEDIQQRKNAILIQKCIRRFLSVRNAISSNLICSNNNSSLLEFAFTVSSYQSSHFLSFIYDSLFSVVNHSVVSSNPSFILSICKFTCSVFPKENNSSIRNQLLSTSVSLLLSTLNNKQFDLLQYGCVWKILLFLWDSSDEGLNESKKLCVNLMTPLIDAVLTSDEESVYSIISVVSEASQQLSIHSPFIGMIFLQVFCQLIRRENTSSVLLVKFYRTILCLLPEQSFKTVHPNYDSFLLLHQMSMEEGSGKLVRLVDLWANEYEKLISYVESDGGELEMILLSHITKLHNQLLSSQLWFSLLKRVQPDNPQIMIEFIILLSELLRLFGVSTLPRLFLSLSNSGVLMLTQLVLYNHNELVCSLLSFCIQHYSSILLHPQEITTNEEEGIFSVFVHCILFCMYFTSMTVDSPPLQTVLSPSFVNSFFSSIIHSCMSLYTTKEYQSSISLVKETAIVKALYLLQSFQSILHLPDLIQNQMVQWPKLKSLKFNYNALVEAMNWIPLLFSFKKRVKAFRSSLPPIQDGESVLIEVHRDNIIEDTYNVFRSMINSKFQFHQRFHIVFFDSENRQESGIDGGGLSREHMTLLLRALLSPEYGLFHETEYGELYPAYKDLDEELQKKYRFVGQVLGRMLLTGQLCEVRFASFFLNSILKNSTSFNELKQRSSSIYQSLLHLRDQASEEELADFTMSVDYTNGNDPTIHTYSFQEDGEHIQVNRGNVELYVQFMAQFYLQESVKVAALCIQTGITDVLSRMNFSLFDGPSFQMLLCGDIGEIDIEDMKRYTEVVNPEGNEEYEDLFWSILSSYSNEEKSRFLLFVTGISRPPLNGFKFFNPRLSVRFHRHLDVNDSSRLPTSHTCFNEIVIPYYDSEEVLRKNLYYCIFESEGYGLS